MCRRQRVLRGAHDPRETQKDSRRMDSRRMEVYRKVMRKVMRTVRKMVVKSDPLSLSARALH